jgi:hypothetical protein
MTNDNRDWRESKTRWVIESAEAELTQWKLTAALSWPQEARPDPMPFQWGSYDHIYGTLPEPGTYWTMDRYASRVEIRARTAGDPTWKQWLFRAGGRDEWSTSVVRGPLYKTEREACLASLWNACEFAAETLAKAKVKLLTASDTPE